MESMLHSYTWVSVSEGSQPSRAMDARAGERRSTERWKVWKEWEQPLYSVETRDDVGQDT